MRTRRAMATAVAAAALLVGCTAAPSPGDPPDDPAPQAAPPPSAAPGTLLDARPVALPDEALERLGATVTRVTYGSRSGLDGAPVRVSGVVIEPAGAPPPGGWPVVSFAHGTTGVADACAPSRSPGMLGQLPVVLPLVQRGYLVTATDYEGLGTPGPHPYLQPVSEGRSVIDAVHAARELVPAASNRWVALGPSQGGQAAWAAAELAGGSGLEFLGAVALAPPTDLAALVDDVPYGLSPLQRRFYPLVLYSLQLRHPQLDYADYLAGPALAAMGELERSCIPAAFGQAPASDFAPRSPAALARAKEWLEEFTLPRRPAAGPLFVAAGTGDDVVPVELVDAGVEAACELGDTVTYLRYPAGHPALPAAGDDALDWIADRFAGNPASSTC
ncbi:MAG: lipase [Pseudonocardiaceae bacterium]|nr:lipase [Pseudonocardiaceae bacterium]